MADILAIAVDIVKHEFLQMLLGAPNSNSMR